VRGTSRMRRHADLATSTTSPPFYKELQRSQLTSWSQHYFVAVGDTGSQMHKTSRSGSKQQEIIN